MERKSSRNNDSIKNKYSFNDINNMSLEEFADNSR